MLQGRHICFLVVSVKDCDGSCGSTHWDQFCVSASPINTLFSLSASASASRAEEDCDGSCGRTHCGQFCLSTSHIKTHFSLRTPWRQR